MWAPGRLPREKRKLLVIPELPKGVRAVLRKKQGDFYLYQITIKRRTIAPFYEALAREDVGTDDSLERYQRAVTRTCIRAINRLNKRNWKAQRNGSDETST